MANADAAVEAPKVPDQAPIATPKTENPSDQQHASTFASSIRRAARAMVAVHIPMSAEIARKFFPTPSEKDRSATIDAAVKSGHIDPSQAERLRKKLTQPQEQT